MPGRPSLLAEPRARVTRTDAFAFHARTAYWIDDWLDYGGSLEDQVRFEREWQALRSYAADRGVRLFGDIPIYVSQGGADHLAHPTFFRHGEVAGVPPDAFARTGQLWGNPLYDWSALRADDYRWWVERMRRMFELVDLTRIDHFRGFVSYWAVPERNKTAAKGRWLRGPGEDLFETLESALGDLPVVAEDLGVITEPVVRLRRALGLPGMVVLQFARRRRSDEPAPAAEPRGTVGRLHRHARQRHDQGLVRLADARGAGVDGARPGAARVEPDGGRVGLARAARDRPAAGRARPRQRGADEPAGDAGGQLAVALRRAARSTARTRRTARAEPAQPSDAESAGGGSSNPHVP